MTKFSTRLTGATPLCAVAIVLLMSIIAMSSPGCGNSPAATDQDEITRFLNENPENQNPAEETSNLDSNEYKGIVRTRERV